MTSVSRPPFVRPLAYLQEWEHVKTKIGWRTRAGGYSLHTDLAALTAFVAAYWALYSEGGLPPEYLREKGKPIRVALNDEELALKLQEKGSLKLGPRQLKIIKLKTGHMLVQQP
jgi:hypothetical protein